ncbi:hypothetical protein [Microbaculum marinum]|uniref:Uncharacterized protein n=1 Tax=Microbaculum marinum TaxID=1764581 RepID=A0AAW9RWU8_9HYPH
MSEPAGTGLQRFRRHYPINSTRHAGSASGAGLPIHPPALDRAGLPDPGFKAALLGFLAVPFGLVVDWRSLQGAADGTLGKAGLLGNLRGDAFVAAPRTSLARLPRLIKTGQVVLLFGIRHPAWLKNLLRFCLGLDAVSTALTASFADRVVSRDARASDTPTSPSPTHEMAPYVAGARRPRQQKR